MNSLKAIIMAGGEGSRLRPLTCDCPKPMLRLMGKPLMEYAVRLLHKHGICDIAATLGYLPDSIMDYFGDGSRLDVRMRFYTEKTPLGTAGSVRQAGDFLNERFIVLSGDGIADFDLSAALRFHERSRAKATLLLTRSTKPQEYGMVVTDGDGRIRSFHEKPGRSDIYSDWINTGIYILEPELLERIPANHPCDFGHDLFPALLKEGVPVYGYACDGYWCDVGDVAAYLQVHFDALDGKIHLPGLETDTSEACVSPGCILEPPVYIAPDAVIEPGAHIGPYSVIGTGCRVGCGAGIKRSLLLEGAKIESGAQLRGCIAGRNCTVSEDAQLFEESVVGSLSSIGSRAILPPGVKIWPEKQVSDGERPESNIVWGARAEERFVSGALMLSSPGQAARCVQACAVELASGEMVIGRDSSCAADALWHAAVAGVMAQGMQVLDAGECSLPQLRQVQNNLHAGAAMLVLADRLISLDAKGCMLSEKKQRSILKLLERQDYARPFSRMTLPMISLGNTRTAYVADTAAAFRADPAHAPCIAITGCDDLAKDVLQRAGIPFRQAMEEENPQPGEIGVQITNCGEDILLRGEKGLFSDVQLQFARAWTARQLGEERLILPIHHTRAIQALDANALFLPGEKAIWLETLAGHSSLQFRLHTDSLFFLMNFISLLTDQKLSLSKWLALIPPAYRRQVQMDIPSNSGGQLLHRLASQHRNVQLGGGMRLQSKTGWAWFSPDGCRMDIFVEAASMEAADELCAFYEKEIRRLLDKQD